ncbi:hypothetical protein LCGC14_2866870, partial [marine sediment metagenome]
MITIILLMLEYLSRRESLNMNIENISSIPIPKEELDKMQQLNSEFCHT